MSETQKSSSHLHPQRRSNDGEFEPKTSSFRLDQMLIMLCFRKMQNCHNGKSKLERAGDRELISTGDGDQYEWHVRISSRKAKVLHRESGPQSRRYEMCVCTLYICKTETGLKNCHLLDKLRSVSIVDPKIPLAVACEQDYFNETSYGGDLVSQSPLCEIQY